MTDRFNPPENPAAEADTAESEICPTCHGVGRISARTALAFPVGSKVWWLAGGSFGRVAAVVTGHSKSLARVKIRYQVRGSLPWSGTVTPGKLESRNE